MAARPPTEKPSRTDEEVTLASGQVLHNTDSLILPTHVQSSESDVELESGNLLKSAPKAAWRRFNGYGRKRVGFFASVKAIVFSSCVSISIIFGCDWYSPWIPQT